MINSDLTKEQSTIKRAIIYLRVSTEEQVENYSLDTQEKICRAEAQRRGYQVVQIFREEGRSAKSIIGRPELINLIAFCKKRINKVNAVFIYRIDRISRMTSDYLAIRTELGKAGVTVISATEPTGNTPTDKFVETLLAGTAQLDNDIRSERTRNGMKARFLSGLPNTIPPVGYILKHGYAVQDPETFDKMKKIWDLMATNTKSLAQLVDIANSMGLRVRGQTLTRHTLSRILKRKFYLGILTSDVYTEEVKGQHTPMITEEQFFKVQAILDGRNPDKMALSHKVKDNPEFPLRRIAKCGFCGSSLTGAWSTARGKKFAYYRCSKFCTGKSVAVKKIENELTELLKDITPTNDARELFISYIQNSFNKRMSRLQKMRNNADKHISKLYEIRNQLVEKNLSGVYSDEIFKEQNEIIQDKILQAQITKVDDNFEQYDVNKITDFMKTLLADLSRFYENASLPMRKSLLASIFPSGMVWHYPGLSKQEIRPLYQSIRTTGSLGVALGDPTGSRIPVPRMRIWCPRPLDDGAIKFDKVRFLRYYFTIHPHRRQG